MSKSNYNGRFPRDLNSAFGPYTSRDFEEYDPMPTADKIALFASVVGFAAFVGLILIGVIV
jgi:hypothetical protein